MGVGQSGFLKALFGSASGTRRKTWALTWRCALSPFCVRTARHLFLFLAGVPWLCLHRRADVNELESSPPMFEKLHGTFVFYRRRAGFERAQIFSPPAFPVLLTGIEPVCAGGELANHDGGFLSHRYRVRGR
jgi:hypothetical protein